MESQATLRNVREQNPERVRRGRIDTGTSQGGNPKVSRSIDFSKYNQERVNSKPPSRSRNRDINESINGRKVSFPSNRFTLPAKFDNNQPPTTTNLGQNHASRKLKLFTTGQSSSKNVFKHYSPANSLSNVRSMNVTIAKSFK